MRISLTGLSLFVIAGLVGEARADDVSEAFMLRFNEVALWAEKVLEAQGAPAAIEIYEAQLAEEDYGRIHLRLGQLRQQLGQTAMAAWHFGRCDADQRVDALDRELICQQGLAETTAVLTVEPPEIDPGTALTLTIVRPEPFAGPLSSGDRVPLGALVVKVEATGRRAVLSELAIEGPTTWRPQVGPEQAPIPVPVEDELISKAFIGEASGDAGDQAAPAAPLRWPAYVTAGVGVALIGTGIYLGTDSKTQLDGLRSKESQGRCAACDGAFSDAESQAVLADGLWVGGLVVAASAVGVWYLFDEAPPAVSPP